MNNMVFRTSIIFYMKTVCWTKHHRGSFFIFNQQTALQSLESGNAHTVQLNALQTAKNSISTHDF
jgi:hypothetical protein